MSHPDCILEEVDPVSNQKVVNCDEPIEELCTHDYHVDDCDCFSKQEQKIKELQATLDRQRKLKEETRRKQEEETKRKQEEETKRKQEEETRRKQEEETKRKQEEETRRKQEEETRRKQEEETRRKQEEETERKQKVIQAKLNEFQNLANEQKKIAEQKYEEFLEANRKYYEYCAQCNKYKYAYDQLIIVHNRIVNPIVDLLCVMFQD
jgi:hypothetical protein